MVGSPRAESAETSGGTARGGHHDWVYDRGQIPHQSCRFETGCGYRSPVIRRAIAGSNDDDRTAARYTVRVEETFEAVYENGVLRPLENLDLSDMQHVLVTISDSAAPDASAYFEPGEWSAARHDDISLEVVRRALSSIPGSLSDTVISSREERS